MLAGAAELIFALRLYGCGHSALRLQRFAGQKKMRLRSSISSQIPKAVSGDDSTRHIWEVIDVIPA